MELLIDDLVAEAKVVGATIARGEGRPNYGPLVKARSAVEREIEAPSQIAFQNGTF
jgi:hypothetical protein